MHKMDNTPRIITIIGLIFEGLGVLGMFFGAWLVKNFDTIPGINATSLEITQTEFNEMMEVFSWLGDVIYGVAVTLLIIFAFNLFVFSKLMNSKLTEEKAKLAYLYQAIWGGINILFNQITGILYLISGVSGYTGHREEKDIRSGI